MCEEGFVLISSVLRRSRTSTRRIKVTVRARDEIVGAFLREKLREILEIEIVEPYLPNIEACIADSDTLTPAERRVLRAFLAHDRIADVAKHLFITTETVKKHLQHIYAKLGVKSLHRAILCAIELGLLRADE